jgi:lysophospholipase L1-like esterase
MLLVVITAFVIFSETAFRTSMGFLHGELDDARSGRFTEEAALTLLFVGDSFTAGESSESAVGYWHYLPRLLEERGVPGPIETLSLAVPGSTSRYHVRQVRKWLAESGQIPDHVVVITGACNWDSLELQKSFVATGTGRRTTNPLLQTLYLGPGGVMWGVHYLGGRLGVVHPGDPQQVMYTPLRNYWYAHEPYEVWLFDETRRAFRELVELSRAEDITPLAGAYIAHQMSGHIRSEAAELTVPFFDQSDPSWEQNYRARGLLHEDEWHLNDAGTKDMAERWADWYVQTHPSAVEPSKPLEGGGGHEVR